jgi:ATP-binding cassette subfamily B multidrug efflux pump
MSEEQDHIVKADRDDGPKFGPDFSLEKPKDFRKTFNKLLDYLRVYRLSLLVVLIFAVASSSFAILGPKILGEAINKLFEGVMGQMSGVGEGIDLDGITNIILMLFGLYVISALFAYIQGWIMAGVSVSVTYRFRKEMSEKINRMPLGYFDRTKHGEVLSRVTNDVETISNTLSQGVSEILTSVTTMIGVLIMMLSISWVMTIASLLILPLSFGIIVFVMSRSQKHFQGQQRYLGHVNGHVEEMYSGHNVMRAFNGEERSIQKFDVYNDGLYQSAWRAEFMAGLLFPIMGFVGNLGYVAVSVLGGYLAVMGSITVGDIQAFIQYVRSFTQPIAQIAQISNVLQQTIAAAERVFDFLEEEEQPLETPKVTETEQIKGQVEFKHVQFGYNPDKIIIRDFSASVKPGQKIAIVGPTGAGKTTIVKLLMRFYDINKGEILIDGVNIQDFSRGDLRRMFGMVLQDAWLYSGTIMENIRYGRADATDDEVIEAAKAAHVDHFIRTLSDGYQTVISEEAANVSQGQKQLLTIARAILANPQMLILDEATSSVDTRTELLIQQAMNNLMQDRTSFIIAHRLSTIRNADLILVMNEGDIIEQGNHDDLLASGGFYADLYNSQFEQQGNIA